MSIVIQVSSKTIKGRFQGGFQCLMPTRRKLPFPRSEKLLSSLLIFCDIFNFSIFFPPVFLPSSRDCAQSTVEMLATKLKLVDLKTREEKDSWGDTLFNLVTAPKTSFLITPGRWGVYKFWFNRRSNLFCMNRWYLDRRWQRHSRRHRL